MFDKDKKSSYSGEESIMERKHLYIIGGILAFLIILFIILVTIQNQPSESQDTTQVNVNSQETPQLSSDSKPSPNSPELSTPEQAASGFYNWYVNHPAPLKSGAYKSRQDVIPEYKESMAAYVRRGLDPARDPVFNCGGGALPKNVDAMPAELNSEGDQALVIMQVTSTGQRLFQIKLQKLEGNWLVKDVWCAP